MVGPLTRAEAIAECRRLIEEFGLTERDLFAERLSWFERFARRLIAVSERRPPDFIIGGEADPYLRRWWLIPRNRIFNVYLHHFLRSDDDRALHDHPWASVSLLLRGSYLEHLPAGVVAPSKAGDLIVRGSGRMAHRIELDDGPCWTLFVTGPRYRQWYFHCPQGLVHWKRFTDDRDSGVTGKGCNQ